VLQNELRGKSNRLVMIAFDLLYLSGQDLRKLPLFERKTHLKKLIEKTAIQFSESFAVEGKEMFAHACKAGLEGVVSKVRDSRYLSGRSRDWGKKTCAQRETLTATHLDRESCECRHTVGWSPDLMSINRSWTMA
jgi:bifunctional non-homologous end joining protein LigD